MIHQYKFKYLLGLLWLLNWGCQENQVSKPVVFASIVPHAMVINQLVDNSIMVEAMVLPGQSPTIYEPTPQQMIRLSRADIYFRTGVPFENSFIDKLIDIAPKATIVDLRHNIKLRAIDDDHHDHDCGHTEELLNDDPHIWLNPILLKKQAATIAEELITFYPHLSESISGKLKELIADLDSLDSQIKRQLASIKQKQFLVFHPTFGYLADRYNLEQFSIEDEGKEPSGEHLVQLVKMAEENKIKNIIVQPQFSSKSARAIADAIGGKVITVDPLPASLESYKANLLRLIGSLQEEKKNQEE